MFILPIPYSSLHYQIVVDQQMRILGRQDIYRT